ncbi:hypothetical protein, partial [Chromohalobacter sp. HP20-39]
MSQDSSAQECLLALRDSIEVHRSHLRVGMLENGLTVWFSVDGNSELRAIRLRAKGRQGVFDLKRA